MKATAALIVRGMVQMKHAIVRSSMLYSNRLARSYIADALKKEHSEQCCGRLRRYPRSQCLLTSRVFIPMRQNGESDLGIAITIFRNQFRGAVLRILKDPFTWFRVAWWWFTRK